VQLLLIRHATNDWVPDRFAGWTPGVRLNEEGRSQAAAVAHRLSSTRLDAVYSSPLERALETAAFVSRPHGLDVQVLEGIGEIRGGDWEGRTLKSLREEPLWGAVQHYPSITRLPGGETLGEVQSRAVAAIEGLRQRHEGGVVAAVSHGDVIKGLIAHYAGLHLDLFQRLAVSPASVSVVQFTPHGPRLALMNDTSGLPSPPENRHPEQ
jgi:probable phosphoglycerate mutase